MGEETAKLAAGRVYLPMSRKDGANQNAEV
jgi:hypothetical protein